jgi:DNA-binding transcriptional regulator GbsR (MarR family)
MVYTSMNYMNSKDSEKNLRALSLSVGDFIRYWGFRRVHGAIWTQLYLSPTPLSGTQIARRLKFSKSLVSPALTELQNWKLIVEVKSSDDKTKLYSAEPDFNAVIKKVLRQRESRLLGRIVAQFDQLNSDQKSSNLTEQRRMRQLETMISSAQLMLDLVLAEDQVLDMPSRIESQ